MRAQLVANNNELAKLNGTGKLIATEDIKFNKPKNPQRAIVDFEWTNAEGNNVTVHQIIYGDDIMQTLNFRTDLISQGLEKGGAGEDNAYISMLKEQQKGIDTAIHFVEMTYKK